MLDPVHSRVGFAVLHAGVAWVRGRFGAVEAWLTVVPGRRATLKAAIAVETLCTEHPPRDRELMGPQHFDVAAFPVIGFQSTRVACGGGDDDDALHVDGTLVIRGISHATTLKGRLLGVELDDQGDTRLGLQLSGDVSRSAFGMRTNQVLGSGQLLIGDRIRLSLDVSAVRRA